MVGFLILEKLQRNHTETIQHNSIFRSCLVAVYLENVFGLTIAADCFLEMSTFAVAFPKLEVVIGQL